MAIRIPRAHILSKAINSISHFQRIRRMASSSGADIPAADTPFSRFNLPGLNLPLNWQPSEPHRASRYEGGKFETYYVPARGEGKKLFRTALNDSDVESGYTSLPLTTLREFTMLQLMNLLTDKPGWEEKVFDDTIAEKWKAEALSTEGRDVTQKMMDWVIDELRYKAKIFKETGAVTVFNGDVVKSDVAIPSSVKKSLQAAALNLENVPEKYKDWHPGSDGKVLDLVHPSLFPLIYDRSRVLEDVLIGLEDCIANCGKGVVVPIRDEKETQLHEKPRYSRSHWNQTSAPYGKNFQWLPSEVDISAEDGRAKFTSYINNLHPKKHQDLYAIIENVITKAIPQWAMTLGPLRDHSYRPRIKIEELEFDPDPDRMPEDERPQQEDDEEDEAFWDRQEQWETDTRRVVQPEPGDFEPRPLPQIDFKKEYGHRGLQVIVKLANIELTPEKPNYEGGTWHVEGQLNEHICATALYYYDCANITESRLAFRQQCSEDDARDIGYPQGVHEWLTEIYGCQNDEPCVQEVGSVRCFEGRLLTFPNILQHQVQPFRLADPTKKGHRKILALFLVDPGIRIISTANVPPQQKDWWGEEVAKQTETSSRTFGKLSAELKDKIINEVDDFPISMAEAKEIRMKLMAERSKYVSDFEVAFENRSFSLCEH